MSVIARRVLLAERPHGLPTPDTWSIDTVELPKLRDGEVLVRVSHLSLDPAMRGWIKDRRSYMPPVAIGEPMRAFGTGTVLESRDVRFATGDAVTGLIGASDHVVVAADVLRPIDLRLAAAPAWLGVLGLTGLTAWFGLFDVARAQPGDTVLVSGAAGAVGSVVGQLAMSRGCRVVGIAGGPEKVRWLTDVLGFDAAIDYRAGDPRGAVRAAAPNGIDVFFDNVGGESLDVALESLRRGARVAICGAISAYNATEPPPGPENYMALLTHRASMTGFLVFDFEDRYPEALEDIGRRLTDGLLVAREHVVEGGLSQFHSALMMLFTGANSGKLVLAL